MFRKNKYYKCNKITHSKLKKNNGNIFQSRYFYEAPMPKMKVFNREVKLQQRENIASLSPHTEKFSKLHQNIAAETADRFSLIVRNMPNVAEITACPHGQVWPHLLSDHNIIVDKQIENYTLFTNNEQDIKSIYGHYKVNQGQKKEELKINVNGVVCDEEDLPLRNDANLDAVISNLTLHWINDLPGVLKSIHNSLRPDGALLASIFGGETLNELQTSFLIAEQEREDVIAPHTSPLAGVRDAGDVVARAGFNLPTVDVERITVWFPDAFTLMHYLQMTAENLALRSFRPYTPRNNFIAAAAVYDALYGVQGKGVPATFEVVHMVGWRPDPTQQKPAQRGTGQVSMEEIAGDLGTELQTLEVERKSSNDKQNNNENNNNNINKNVNDNNNNNNNNKN